MKNTIVTRVFFALIMALASQASRADIDVSVHEVRANAPGQVSVKEGCRFQGWDRNEDAVIFFANCDGQTVSLRSSDAIEIDAFQVDYVDQSRALELIKSTHYGIDWEAVSTFVNAAD
ncbi:MAG: hypothetical protein AWU57_1510 [Marinobacter sp. T13-3]|nr:MAG: hypothetical protein AWU57_1510 [Marinobacter sp. T13-3]